MKTIITALLLVLVTSPAFAAKSYDSYGKSGKTSHAYIGVSGGKNTIAADTTTWAASTTTSLFAGYSFNDFVSAEAAYTSLGTAETDPATTLQAKGSLMSLSAVGYIPMGKVFSLFGRVGYGQSKLEVEVTTFSESFSGVVYGAGAQFNLGQRVGIRLAYDKFKVPSSSTTQLDSSLVSVGALFKF